MGYRQESSDHTKGIIWYIEMRNIFIYCFDSGSFHCTTFSLSVNRKMALIIYQCYIVQTVYQDSRVHSRMQIQSCSFVISLCLSVWSLKKKNTFTHHFTKSCGVKTQSGISDTCLVTLQEVRMREKLVAHLRCLPRWYKIMCCSEFECML